MRTITRFCTAAGVGALVAGAALFVAPPSALADTEITVDAGVNDFYNQMAPIPITVTIRADQVIDGRLVIRREIVDEWNDSFAVEQPIEIASGTTKQYSVMLPASWDSERLAVTVFHGRDEVATKTTRLRQSSFEFVGVLPRLAGTFETLPPQVDLPDGLGRAALAAISEPELALGLATLASYDQLVANGADLASLSSAQRDDLFRWVDAGGRLLLDDLEAVALVPPAWSLGEHDYTLAGLGEIRYVDGVASAGDWTAIIDPSPEADYYIGSDMVMDPQADLARRANLDFPAITPLAVLLLVYALIVGPLLFVVLRRARRTTLGWVAVPALALVVTAAVTVSGGGRLRAGTATAAAVVQTGPTGGFGFANMLSFAGNSGALDITLPDGWAPTSTSMFGWWGNMPVGREWRLTWTGERSLDVSSRLEPRQGRTLALRGPTTTTGLRIDAHVDGNNIIGTIYNGTTVRMSQVVVFADTQQLRLGELAAGDSVDFEMRQPRDLRTTWETRSTRAWGDVVWTEHGATPPPAPEGAVAAELGVWGNAGIELEMYPRGLVRVAGWTDELSFGLVDEGGQVTGLTAVGTVDGPAGVSTVRAQIVRHPFGSRSSTQLVTRYVVPPNAAGDVLELYQLDRLGIQRVELWDGAQWLPFVVDDLADDDVLEVPAAAVRSGVVLVRSDTARNSDPAGVPILRTVVPPGWFSGEFSGTAAG